MSIEDYKFLANWLKDKCFDEETPIRWPTQSPTLLPKVWEYIASSHQGSFFLKILSKINPTYFYIPYTSDTLSILFNQMKKFLLDHFLDPGSYLSHLKSSFSLESSKWEFLELIFLVSFISSIQQESLIFSDLLCFEHSLPKVLQLTLKILLRALEKLKIEESTTFSSPISAKNAENYSKRTSSGKRMRQEELLEELEDLRRVVNEMKKKLKEKDCEIVNLKSLTDGEYRDVENTDVRLYTKIRMLEEAIGKNRLDFDEKNLELIKLKQEIAILNDEIDQLKFDNENYKNSISKYQEALKKAQSTENVIKQLEECKQKLKESYQDKEILVIELQSAKVNKTRVELLENQLSALVEEKYEISKELINLKRAHSSLLDNNAQNTQLISQIPLLKEEIQFWQQKADVSASSSQKNSLTSICPNLQVEELEAKIDSLTKENERLESLVNHRQSTTEFFQHFQNLNAKNEVYFIKSQQMECELLQIKLDWSKQAQIFNDRDAQRLQELILTKTERDNSMAEVNKLTERLRVIERSHSDCSKIIENLRNENFKLRDSTSKLRADIERLKSESVARQQDCLNLKSELLKNADTVLSLETQTSHLLQLIEAQKLDELNQSTNELTSIKDLLIPISIIIKSLETLLEADDIKPSLNEYLTQIRSLDAFASPQTATRIENLIEERQDLIAKVKDESEKRYEAERKCLILLKKLRE